MPEEINDILRENIAGPRSVQSDQGTVQQHDPRSILEVLKHEEGKKAGKKKMGGLRYFKFRPPGAD